MSTNDDVDNDKEVTEDDLRKLKYESGEVESSENEEDESAEVDEEEESTEVGEEDGQTDDQTESEEESEESEEDSEFDKLKKEFPYIKGDTPEEFAKNLSIAYKNSSAEAIRLKKAATGDDDKDGKTDKPKSITDLYVQNEIDKKINEAWNGFKKDYPQVEDPAEYEKFVATVDTLQKLSLSQDKLTPPGDLYNMAAAALRWESNGVSSKDRTDNAIKDRASSTKPTGSGGKPRPKSKVTDEMIAVNRKMYPGKTDAEIRAELEPYVK
jgi:hypothetical protein